MESFKTYFESVYIQQDTFSRQGIERGLGIETTDNQWKHIESFPQLFDNKLLIRQVHIDPRYKESNEKFIRKVFALTAACLGYGVQQGYKLPKTKLTLKRSRSGEETFSGQHTHYRERSWSHEITIFLDHIIPDISSLIEFIAHELIHSLQVSMRKLHTPYTDPDRPKVRWKRDWHDIVSPSDDYEKYRNQPWEVEAYDKAEEAVEYAMKYLQTGVVRGFNPKRV